MTLIPITPIEQDQFYEQLIRLAVDAVDSLNSKRNYRAALTEFLGWYDDIGRPGLTKAVVQRYKTILQEKGLAASTINVKLSAIRRLVGEAADNGLVEPALANGIKAVRSVRVEGNRTGNWLTKQQAQALLEAPGHRTLKGIRDSAILAVLLGAALRRDEAANLQVEHLQQRDGTWGIVDMQGKRGKLRTIPIPVWVKNVVQIWLDHAGLEKGYVFLPLRRGGHLDYATPHMSGTAIWKVVTGYCVGFDFEVTPHDLRRTAAKLMLDGGAPIEQISLILGHTDIKTTQRYLGIDLDWDNPATSFLGLRSPLGKREDND